MKDQFYTGTTIEFRVVYTDIDNDQPTTMNFLYCRVNGEWNSEELRVVDSDDNDYQDGKEYFMTKKFNSSGKWKYSFEFKNAENPKKSTQSIEFEVRDPPGPVTAWNASKVIIVMSSWGSRRLSPVCVSPCRSRALAYLPRSM